MKITRNVIITTTVITLLWSIIDNTFMPACVNLSIVLLISLFNE